MRDFRIRINFKNAINNKKHHFSTEIYAFRMNFKNVVLKQFYKFALKNS